MKMFPYANAKDTFRYLRMAELAAGNLAGNKCKFGPQAVTAQFFFMNFFKQK